MKFTAIYICWTVCFLSSLTSFEQKTAVRQYLNIIQQGFCDNDKKSCPQQQINFLKACNELGDLYFQKKYFDSALKYYSIAAEISDHVYMHTNYARKLQVDISDKAASILWNKKHTHNDSVRAFFISYSFLQWHSKKQLIKLSGRYFHFSKDTFYAGHLYNEKMKRVLSFAVNPFFVYSKTTQNKIVYELFQNLAKVKTVYLKFGSIDFPSSEANYAYFSAALFYIKTALQRRFPKINFKTDVDFGSQTTFLEIGTFIWFPVLEATIDP